MRQYANFTNETVTHKVWTIDTESVTQSNLTSLASKDIKARLVQNDPAVIDYQGYQYRYSGTPGRVEFDTTSDEQEFLLKLIYGDNLKLLLVTVVTPQQITTMDL